LCSASSYESGAGLNYEALLVLSLVIGFGGSFISLAMSKWMAKRSTGAQVITQPRNEIESWLLNVVERQARQAGIEMPEVAIYNAPDMNAFATGARRNAALVAVSTGLLQGMPRDEVEAVLAHEISHVANGDMVTLTLVQGVVNTFVIFLSRVVGHFIDRAVLRNESGHGIGYFVSVMVAQVLLGILASIIVMWVSRQREFRADAGSAKLCRCRLGKAEWLAADDSGAGPARSRCTRGSAGIARSFRHFGQQTPWLPEAVYEPSADRRAHCGAAERVAPATIDTSSAPRCLADSTVKR
jgi:Zn-dependent protease with chaperone function